MDGADVQCCLAHQFVWWIVKLEMLQLTDSTRCFVDRVVTPFGHGSVRGHASCSCIQPERAFMANVREIGGRFTDDNSTGPIECALLTHQIKRAFTADFLASGDHQLEPG